jgi:hypothetical protein
MEVGGATAADAMQAPDQQQDEQGQQVMKEAPERDPSGASVVGAGEQLEFTIVFGKASSSVKRAADSTMGELKADAEARTGELKADNEADLDCSPSPLTYLLLM